MNYFQAKTSSTSSTSNIQIWDIGLQTGTWSSSNIREYVSPITVSKFKIGETIVYFSYLKWSKKIATHKIIDIRDNLYIFTSPYNGDEYTMKCAETDIHFMEYSECLEKFPELFIGATRNGK
jgi:hypothetical protein